MRDAHRTGDRCVRVEEVSHQRHSPVGAEQVVALLAAHVAHVLDARRLAHRALQLLTIKRSDNEKT